MSLTERKCQKNIKVWLLLSIVVWQALHFIIAVKFPCSHVEKSANKNKGGKRNHWIGLTLQNRETRKPFTELCSFSQMITECRVLGFNTSLLSHLTFLFLSSFSCTSWFIRNLEAIASSCKPHLTLQLKDMPIKPWDMMKDFKHMSGVVLGRQQQTLFHE